VRPAGLRAQQEAQRERDERRVARVPLQKYIAIQVGSDRVKEEAVVEY
jgi:hypothetical protein